jgi:signal transduction histidine kinase
LLTDDYLARLLSLISHEVRGPLGVVRGYLRLLDQQAASLSDMQRQTIAAMMKAADRATDLTAQVSTLARLHRGEIVPAFTPLPLGTLLQRAVEAVALPQEPHITVHIGTTPQVSVLADELLLRAALTSLVLALVRAQPADTKVYLVADNQTEGRGGVTITVTAMEPISASHTDTKLDIGRGGLGLELPIAAFIIDAHNGRVRERRDNNRLVGVVVWLPTA